MGRVLNTFLPTMVRRSPVFCEPAEGDGRQRDVFPLPCLDLGVELIAKKGLSRGVQQRLHRRNAVLKRTNQAIVALNSMFSGNPIEEPSKVSSLRVLPFCQRDAIGHIMKRVQETGGPPPGASHSEAVCALRVASSSYQEPTAGVGDVVSMDLDLLSLPSLAGKGVDLQANLKGPEGDMLRNFDDMMLQDAQNWGHIASEASAMAPYSDPQLSQTGYYLRFLHRLHHSGVLTFCLCPRGRVGAFCVSKKAKEVNGKLVQKQRLILDCRQTNLQFRAAPLTTLGSLSSLCEGHLEEHQQLFIGGGDIQDCFYACRTPRQFQRFFCLDVDISVNEAKHIMGSDFPEDLLHLPGDYKISPSLSVLPMGFSWSFFLVQKLHEQLTLSSLGIQPSQLVADGNVVPTFSDEACAGMPYCDNVHVLSCSQVRCEAGRVEVIEKLKSVGFGVHEEIEATTLFPTLGGIIDGKAGQIRPTPTRLWNLILAFEYAAKSKVSSDFIQRLLGHAMCICVLCRPGMSIFRSLYDFSIGGFPQMELWDSAKRECIIFAGILPLLFGDIKRPWSTMVSCTDASPDGFGIVEREMDVGDVQSMGSWNERWRFKRLPVSSWRPRDRALGKDVFCDHSTARRPEALGEQSHEFVEDPLFPEIPHSVLKPSDWKTTKIGRWHDTSEHITLKEGRCLLLCLRRLSRSSSHRNKKHLVFVDNLGLALAITKGRAHNYRLLRICQQIGALSLVSNIGLKIRWIPSEVNPSDGPSRGDLNPHSAWYEIYSEEAGDFQNQGGAKFEGCSSSRQESEKDQGEDGGSSPESESFGQGEVEEHSIFEVETEEKQSKSGGGANVGHLFRDGAVGSSEREWSPEEAVPELPSFVQGLLSGARSDMATRGEQDHGHDPLGLLRQFVPGWKKSGGRREGDGSGRVRFHRLQGPSSQSKKGAEGVEASLPPSEPPAAAKADSLWHCNDLSCERKEKYGRESLDGLRPVLEAGRGLGHSRETHSPTRVKSWSPVSAICRHHSGHRGRKARQDGHLRQHSASGQSPHQRDVRAGVGKAVKVERTFKTHLQLQQRGVPHAIRECCQDLGSEQGAHVPAPPRWSQRRPEFKDPRSLSNQREREVENRLKLEAVRKNRKNPKDVARLRRAQVGVLQESRVGHASSHARSDSSQTAIVSEHSWRTFPEKFALEVFAGSARLSTAIRSRGYPCFPLDVCIDPCDNVLDVKVRSHIFGLIRKHRITFIWIGMPCTSFSVARRNDGIGPGPLRSDTHPMGLPHLLPHDMKKVREGNLLLEFCYNLILECNRYNVPWALENPATSRCWLTPLLKKLSSSAHFCILDFCQFGEPWKKQTAILHNGVDLSTAQRLCIGGGKVCSRTGKKHLVLKGISPTGAFWTLVAQPYPFELVDVLSNCLFEQIFHQNASG